MHSKLYIINIHVIPKTHLKHFNYMELDLVAIP